MNHWVSWLALIWMLGAGVMLARGISGLAAAERLRRFASPLKDRNLLDSIEEARRKLRIAGAPRAMVTKQLKPSAVVGLLVPTLILTLSIITSMPLGQVRFVNLHELAHTRRRDYLVNLFQILVEALLFFNPAVAS